jgi:hypothetical protein
MMLSMLGNILGRVCTVQRLSARGNVTCMSSYARVRLCIGMLMQISGICLGYVMGACRNNACCKEMLSKYGANVKGVGNV